MIHPKPTTRRQPTDGEACSRQQDPKHGTLAQALAPPPLEGYESHEDLDALLQALRDDLAPASPTEDVLVRAIAGGFWRLARLHRAEAGIIAAAQEAGEPGHTGRDETDCPFEGRGSPSSRSFSGQVAALSRALDDPPALRRLLARLGRPCAGLPDGSLRDIALQCIVDLQEQDAQRRARASLPPLETALALACYETQLHRRIRHNLATLECLQRLRRAAARRLRHRSTLPGLRWSFPPGHPQAVSSSRGRATRD